MRTEQAPLCHALAARLSTRRTSWQVTPLGEADAWCVNGSRVARLPDGTLRIVPGLASGRSIRIHPDEVDWPIAYSTPAGPPDFRPTYAFDLDSPASIEAMLEQLEGWLRPLVVQFYLASQILQENVDLRSGVFHVIVRGKLYAVVSRRNGVGVWPLADPAQLADAVWSHRPEAADDVPHHFVRTDLHQLLWQYGIRTGRDWLPPHYRTKRLFLRRPPSLPTRLLTDASLLLVRELGHSAGTFDELAQRTGIAAAQLARHLAALSMVGSITANPDRATTGGDSGGWVASVPSAEPASVSPNSELTVRLKASRVPDRAPFE